nr:YwaF family protein [Clostridia bacterium]
MRNFFLWLFEKRATPCEITLFNFWHIFYLVLIVGAIITAGVFLSKKSAEVKMKVLSVLSVALCALYAADFFIMPLYMDTIDVDKLPFHICTVLCPVVAFVQFNKKFERFREPVAFLAVVAPLMYLVYPGAAVGDLSAFCYKVLQTFIYHGTLLCWGYLNIATGIVKPEIKNSYKALIGICMIAVWAMIGNLTYGVAYNYGDGDPHFDWFFLTGSTFPFVPKILMPLCVIVAVFGMVLIIYGLWYLVMNILDKKRAASSADEEEKETAEV